MIVDGARRLSASPQAAETGVIGFEDDLETAFSPGQYLHDRTPSHRGSYERNLQLSYPMVITGSAGANAYFSNAEAWQGAVVLKAEPGFEWAKERKGVELNVRPHASSPGGSMYVIFGTDASDGVNPAPPYIGFLFTPDPDASATRIRVVANEGSGNTYLWDQAGQAGGLVDFRVECVFPSDSQAQLALRYGVDNPLLPTTFGFDSSACTVDIMFVVKSQNTTRGRFYRSRDTNPTDRVIADNRNILIP